MRSFHGFTITLIIMMMLASVSASAADDFSIGIIVPAAGLTDDSEMRKAIGETDDDNLAFVVANGIKSASEPCSDALYLERKLLLDAAKNGLIVSLAGNDWTDCRTSANRSSSIERLNRLRELMFAEDLSFGGSKLPLSRQSNGAKFRSYSENARWEFGPVLFATVNLPADNNHFLLAAGRNNEFEDRSIANREWLQRLVTIATRRKLAAVVLFCDGDPLTLPVPALRHDGYSAVRAQLIELAAHFPGRILVIHNRSAPPPGSAAGIAWTGNLGTLAVASGWLRLSVAPATPALFTVTSTTVDPPSRASGKKAAVNK